MNFALEKIRLGVYHFISSLGADEVIVVCVVKYI